MAHKRKFIITAIISLLVVAAWVAPVISGSLFNNPKFQALDADGNLLSGGKLYTYLPGTTTAKATYSDRSLASANANPVVLDSRGEATIYGAGMYKFVLKDSSDVTIWTMDNLEVQGGGGSYVFYPDPSESDHGKAGNGSSLYDYLTALGTSKKATVRILHNGSANTTTYTVGTSYDASAYTNVKFEAENGALLSPSSSKTLTLLASRIQAAPDQQIFSGAGTVAFADAGVIHPGWFGTPTDGSTDSTAYWTKINTAMVAGSTIKLQEGADYYINTAAGITFSKKVHIQGFGATFTVGATVGQAAAITVSGSDCLLEGFAIDGDQVGATYVGAYATELRRSLKITGSRTTIRKLTVTDSIYGIDLYDAQGGELHGCYFENAVVTTGEGYVNAAAIVLAGADDWRISSNQINGFGSGILLRSGASTAPLRNKIYSNIIYNCDDNPIYGSTAEECEVFSNFIHTSDGPLKMSGSRNNVHHNEINANSSVATATILLVTGQGTPSGDYNGIGINVCDNILYGACTSAAIYVSEADSGSVRDMLIAGNDIRISGGGSAIRVAAANLGTQRVRIANNYATGHAYGIIAGITASSAKYHDDWSISGNIMQAGSSGGFALAGLRYSWIYGNKIGNNANTTTALNISAASYNHIAHNFCGDNRGVSAVQNTGISETTYDSIACDYNTYIENDCEGVDVSRYVLQGVNNLMSVNHRTVAAAGAWGFTIGEASRYIATPGGNVNFNPAAGAVFPLGYEVTVINIAGAAHTITFDSTGLNAAIAQNNRGIFVFDGTAWRKVYIGS